MGTSTALADPAMRYKTTSGPLLATDDDTGTFEALVSITGVVDSQNELLVPGAYADTLTQRTPKGVRSHRWDKPVARTLAIEEWMPGDPRLPAELTPGVKWPTGAGALWVKGQYNLQTRDGKDAYADAKFYGEVGQSQWSVGVMIKPGAAERRKSDGVVLVKTVDLYEYSDVLHGAASQTRTLTIKDARDLTIQDALDGADPGTEQRDSTEDEHRQNEPVAGQHDGTAAQAGQADLHTKGADVLPGSFEQRRESVRAAVTELLRGAMLPDGDPEWYVMVIGTWPDRVVVTRYNRSEGKRASESYQVPYTVDDRGAVQLGEPAAVDLQLQVVPAAKQDQPGGSAVAALLELLADTAAVAALVEVDGTRAKAGRMLSAPNAERIRKAVAELLAVLAAAGVAMDGSGGDSAKSGQPAPAEPHTVVLDMADVQATLAGLNAARA